MSVFGGFFRKLLDTLLPPRKTEKLLRETPYDAYARLLRVRPRNDIEALLPYDDPRAMALIWELKYYDSAHAARVGGALLANHIAELIGEDLLETPLLFAIPLHKARERERGYNQAERLAAEVAKRLGSAVMYKKGGLVRTRATARQTDLAKRDRLYNVRGAFSVADPQLVEGRVCIVIDDVVTTGATLTAGAEVLRASGATRVFPIALTYAG